ncbi:hypothetical protein GUJ93_ZPchr0006g43547 [Zizania palustris]|uniref:Uncharacterized protein n=1 Tax=Zizania palustris TaxID=103762 RepID=A0A8J5SZA6_ZIZPA|nr:hypothetical protein GUJ93_ZPchr0006g43547 [Zizania palustris]
MGRNCLAYRHAWWFFHVMQWEFQATGATGQMYNVTAATWGDQAGRGCWWAAISTPACCIQAVGGALRASPRQRSEAPRAAPGSGRRPRTLRGGGGEGRGRQACAGVGSSHGKTAGRAVEAWRSLARVAGASGGVGGRR